MSRLPNIGALYFNISEAQKKKILTRADVQNVKKKNPETLEREREGERRRATLLPALSNLPRQDSFPHFTFCLFLLKFLISTRLTPPPKCKRARLCLRVCALSERGREREHGPIKY